MSPTEYNNEEAKQNQEVVRAANNAEAQQNQEVVRADNNEEVKVNQEIIRAAVAPLQNIDPVINEAGQNNLQNAPGPLVNPPVAIGKGRPSNSRFQMAFPKFTTYKRKASQPGKGLDEKKTRKSI